MKLHRITQRAFTLVELLVVVGIIVIVAAISMAGLTDLNRTAEYADAGNSILSRMHMARQTAIAKNKIVEVRFYKTDEFGDDSRNLWQAMGVVIPGDTFDDPAIPQGELYFLPSVLSIDNTSAHSSLLDPTLLPDLAVSATDSGDTIEQPVIDTDSIYGKMEGKEYVGFQYLPDGSTTLAPDDTWFLTVREKQEILRTQGGDDDTLANFSTIILNPYTGRGSIYRP
jgi:uncharacterized protein (TIGR02596 family)